MKLRQQLWYGCIPWLILLWPLEMLFRTLAARRRRAFQQGTRESWRAPVPVLVVGNISVGGVGKTPLVISLVEMLQQAGYRPGVVSRGYGGRAPAYPLAVTTLTSATHCGDEPLMIHQRCGCPLVVDPDRVRASQHLLETTDVDIIISDDGLQHYALQRDIEICVIDGDRGLGNGHCLPVGPLREPEERLGQVDFCIVNGGNWQRSGAARMQLEPEPIKRLDGGEGAPATSKVNAVAGIGNPERFFESLRELGFDPVCHSYADHYRYRAEDLEFDNGLAVVMTEKDAVKCRAFGADNRYYLPVRAVLPETFAQNLLAEISVCADNKTQ